MNNLLLKKTANQIRKGIVTAVHSAKAGHPGGSLSAADIYTYLYFEEMNIDPENPQLPKRDRFVLSKGHTAPGLYSTLAHRGFFPVSDLTTLRKLGSHLQGHPCMQHTPGVDMSSGSLGQGISAAVGMALAGKMDGKNYRVYTLLGDGEIQEGQVWEASMFAGHRQLDNLVVIVDNNGLQIDGAIDQVCSPYPIDAKFAAFNFHVINVDAHDFDALRAAFKEARATKGKPTAIIARSLKGKGVSFMEGQAAWHGAAPNDEQYQVAMADLAAIDAELDGLASGRQNEKEPAVNEESQWQNAQKPAANEESQWQNVQAPAADAESQWQNVQAPVGNRESRQQQGEALASEGEPREQKEENR